MLAIEWCGLLESEFGWCLRLMRATVDRVFPNKLRNPGEMVHDAQTLESLYEAKTVFVTIDGARIDDFIAMGHVFARIDPVTPG